MVNPKVQDYLQTAAIIKTFKVHGTEANLTGHWKLKDWTVE